jgi:hypothetical protein
MPGLVMTIELDVAQLSPEQLRIHRATESIRAMADEIPEDLRPAALSVRLRRMTISAPLHSVVIAFLLGLLLARRALRSSKSLLIPRRRSI